MLIESILYLLPLCQNCQYITFFLLIDSTFYALSIRAMSINRERLPKKHYLITSYKQRLCIFQKTTLSIENPVYQCSYRERLET